MAEFKPPVTSFGITEYHNNDTGDIDRATLLVVDEAGSEFALTVEAAAEHDQSVLLGWQEGEELDDDVEPVFVVPGKSIAAEDLDNIVTTPSELLVKYLVEQVDADTDSDLEQAS